MWNSVGEGDRDNGALEKRAEMKEMKALQSEFIGNISTCLNNKNVSEYYRIATEANQDIKDWYDRDFDTSDHMTQIAKFAAAIVLEAAVTIFIGSIGAPAMVGVAVVAGVNGVVAYEEAYYSGSTSGEATTIAGVTFSINMATGGLGVYGESRVANRGINEYIEHIETGQIDDVVEATAKHSDDMFDMTIDPEEFNKLLDDMNVEKFTPEEVIEIVGEVATSKSEEEAIEELDEYLDEKGLECSDETIKLLVAILRDGTK